MAKIKKINHIGVAPKDLQKANEFWTTLGLALEHEEEVASDAVKTYFYPVGESSIELLEATADTSPVQKFLDKKGGGIHHLCLEVEGLDEILSSLQEQGVRLIDTVARKGAHGYRVAFVHPQATGGILLELSEKEI